MKLVLFALCLLGIEASFLEILKKAKPTILAEDTNKKQHNSRQQWSSPNGRGGSHEFVESLRHNVAQGKENILRLLQQQQPNKPTAASKSIQRFEEKTKKVLHVVAAAPMKSPRPSLRTLLATKGGANKKKRVLILMSDTGGGHRASAVAIDKAMSERIPGKVDVTVMDIWTDHAKWPFNNFVPYYRFLAKHPLLWRGMYVYGAFPPTKLFTETWSWLACYKSFKKAIVDTDPDLVVSVHPLCQLMPISIVKDMNKVRSKDRLPIPFVTVVTDLGGAHSTWFDRRTDMCFVPSEAVRQIALKNRVQPDKIVMHGLPIRPAFWHKPKPKAVLRKALHLKQNIRSVLLMGGGDGVGGLEQITVELAKRLKESKKESQIVVICGHNKITSGDWCRNLNNISPRHSLSHILHLPHSLLTLHIFHLTYPHLLTHPHPTHYTFSTLYLFNTTIRFIECPCLATKCSCRYQGLSKEHR